MLSMSSLEDLLSQISDGGYRLSSLAHLDTGDWRAELRTTIESQAADELMTTDVGFGLDPASALSMALKRIEAKERRTLAKAASQILNTTQPKLAAATLLASLGLRKPVEVKL
jgi:hypothetical protein